MQGIDQVQSESMASYPSLSIKTFDCFKMSNQLKLKFQLQTVFLLMIVVMNFTAEVDKDSESGDKLPKLTNWGGKKTGIRPRGT